MTATLRRLLPCASVLAVGALAFTVAGLLLNATGTGFGWTALALVCALAVFGAFLPLTDVTPGGGA